MLPERKRLYLAASGKATMNRSFKRSTLLIVLVGFFAAGPVFGQYFRQSSYWKSHRQEISGGFGIANFLGELGGRNEIGSPFVWDLEFSQTRPAISLAYRYYLTRKMALRTTLGYGILAGNDNLTTEPFRSNRNLNFKTDLFELSLALEFHLFSEELGHVYDLRGVKGTKSSRVGFYAFIGIGGIYFDPKAQFNNAWVKLRPLGTEGQGLPGGAEPYSNFSVAVPMGVGLRKAVSRSWSYGLELQYSKTFTDYIDDVSGLYYDNATIAATNGAVAAYLADPSLRLDGLGNPTAAGQQRGDSKDLDAYLFFKLEIHYKIYKYKSKSKKYRYRLRRQKIVF